MPDDLTVVDSQPLPDLKVVNSAPLSENKPGILDKANEYAGKALAGAGLPTSIANIPDWFKHLTGTHEDSQPFWQPIRDAIKNPTQENLVKAVPFIGPSSVEMSKDVKAGNYGGALATLAGTVAGPMSGGEVGPGLKASKATLADANALANKVVDRAAGHSLIASAAKELLPEPPPAPDFHGGAYNEFAGESGKPVPVSKNPTPGGYTGPVSVRNAAKANAVQPLAPIAGPAYPTAEQLAQGPVKLSDLMGEKPSGVTVVPEPRAPFAGETPNYMASVPRGTLQDLALAGKPGAGTQLQQLGQQVLYAPSGAGISNLKSSIALRDLLASQPGDLAKSTSNIKLSAGEDLGPGLGTEHTIHTPDGKRIGSVTVEPKGDGVLHVNWLGGDLAGNASRSDIMNALKQEYPGTEKITYDRRRLAKGADAATTEPREMTVSGS